MKTSRTCLFLLVFTLACMLAIPSPAHALEYSIPVNGRFAGSKIALEIPSTPKWAHDVVVNASLVWNNGQLWFQHTYFPDGGVYTFVEANPANVTISYDLPSAIAGIAVGWTDYTYAPSSTTIVSARTFLDPAVFNATQANNATARQYAFSLALHELGRVLGLGNIIDGKDIMDPLNMPGRATRTPMLSILDLYAVHVLASVTTLSSLVIVLNTDQYQLLNAASFLSTLPNGEAPVSSLNSSRDLTDSPSPAGTPNQTFGSGLQYNSINPLPFGDPYAYGLLVVIFVLSSLGVLVAKKNSKHR